MEIEKVEVLDITMNFFEYLVKVTLKDGRFIHFLNNTADEDWHNIKICTSRIHKGSFSTEERITLSYNLKPVLDKKCKEFSKKLREKRDKETKKFTIEKIDVSHL